MSLEQERRTLSDKLEERRKAMPVPPPLDLKVFDKCTKNGDIFYEEWKVEYTVQDPETMPISAGQKVPAYLLIPKSDDHKPPFPAMVCFHQCNVDCLLAKEAVVGKVLYRPDQAYGYELVTQGFVVLAPDTINCGERNIPSIRKADELKWCHAERDRILDVLPYGKGVYDGIRAVDLLQSLDFVDSERIGTIGHSMGAYDAFWGMLNDPRIKATIISCSPNAGALRNLPLASPRLLISLFGLLDKTMASGEVQKIREAFESAKRFYEADGVPENLILRLLNCAHQLPKEFKLEAYAKLKAYFGIQPVQETVSLEHILKQARQNLPFISWASQNEGEQLPEAMTSDPCYISANQKQLTKAFEGLFIALNLNRPADSPFKVEVNKKEDVYEVLCSFQCDKPEEANDNIGGGYNSWGGEQIFFDHSVTLRKERVTNEMRYVVTLKKAN